MLRFSRARFLSLATGLLFLVSACTRLASLASIQTPVAELKPGNYKQTIVFDGRARAWNLHLPTAITARKPLPLVVVLHGGGGNSENAERMSGMSAKADREGFIVVYPDGTGRLGEVVLTWNVGNCCGYALDNNVDDVGFIRALVEQLVSDYPVDRARVFVTGISNGGMMAYRLACELADRIAGIAPVAGALNGECKPSAPVSVVIFHGTADWHVLYEGGAPKTRTDPHDRVDQSVAYAVSFWVNHNACAPDPQKKQAGDVVAEIYSPCRNDSSVALYTIVGGGHAWPGGRGTVIGDEPSRSISATDVMWDFFAAHPRR